MQTIRYNTNMGDVVDGRMGECTREPIWKHHECDIHHKVNNSKTHGRPEGHKSHLHRPEERLRSGTEGGYLDMDEEAQRYRIVGPMLN